MVPRARDGRRVARAATLAGIGVVAGVAATAIAARVAHVPPSSPITPPGVWRTVLIAGVVAATVLYLCAVGLASRRAVPFAAALAIAVAVQAVPLVAPLLLSTDARAYWLYGHAPSVGESPYAELPPRQPPSVYGPLFTLASEPVGQLSEPTGVYVFRAFAAVCILVTALLAARLASDAGRAVAFLGWNPLVALHSAGGGHNDALTMALVLGALVLALHERAEAAGGAWAASVLVKWISLPLYAAALVERWRLRRRLGLAGAAVVVAVALAAAFARYGQQWLHVFPTLSHQGRQASSIGVLGWLARAGVSHRAALAIDALLELAVVAFLLVQAWRRRLRLGVGAALLVLVQGRLNPWYGIWPVALAAADEDDRAGRWLALALTVFLIRDVLPL